MLLRDDYDITLLSLACRCVPCKNAPNATFARTFCSMQLQTVYDSSAVGLFVLVRSVPFRQEDGGLFY